MSGLEPRGIDVQRYLPYRSPFLLVDRVLEIEKDKRILCMKNLSYGEAFWVETHYPGRPIFPGALMMEALAQAGLLLLNVSSGNVDDGRMGVLCRVDLKYLEIAVPGDQLLLDVRKLGELDGMWKMASELRVGGKVYCTGVITGARVPKDG
jgi:3-hydroxyacyl-[acyl-carrier-protein] dehydratase